MRVRSPVWRDHLLAALAVLVVALLYYPVTRAYFFSDDVLLLVRIATEPLGEVLLEPHGGHVLPLRNAVFVATHALFGFDPRPYYWCAFLTHLVNVWLLFRLLRRLTGSAALGCLGATMWGICPAHAASVGWYAVYGQLLVATVTLIVLDQVARVENAASLGWARVFLWCVLLLVGATSFGVGIGVALVFPILVTIVLPGAMRRAATLVPLLGLPVLVVGFYRWVTRRRPASASTGMFEAIVATAGAAPVALMLGHLFACGATVLVLGFFVAEPWPYVTTGYPDAKAVVVVASGGAAVLGAFAVADDRHRRWLLAAATLAIGAYGIVALGRAAFRVDDLAWQAGQGRYHYVGTIALALLLCLTLDVLGRRCGLQVLRPRLLLVCWLGIAAVGWARSGWRVETRASGRIEALTALQEMDAAIDAAPPGATVLLETRELSGAIRGMMLGQEALPGRAALFVLAYPSDLVRGRRVRFVERNVSARAFQAARGGRLAGLLVSPETAGGDGP